MCLQGRTEEMSRPNSSDYFVCGIQAKSHMYERQNTAALELLGGAFSAIFRFPEMRLLRRGG